MKFKYGQRQMIRSIQSHTTCFRNQSGFSIISALIAVGILAIVANGIISLISHQSTESKFIKQQLFHANLNYLLLQTFSNSDTCFCNLMDLPGDKDGADNIKSGDINSELVLKTVKSGCASSAQNIINANGSLGEAGDNLGMAVDEIKIKNIVETLEHGGTDDGSDYMGVLEVRYKSSANSGLVRAINPIKIPLTFQADTHDNIVNCWRTEEQSCYKAQKAGGMNITVGDCNSKQTGGPEEEQDASKSVTTFGHGAGERTVGEGNVFIGHQAGIGADHDISGIRASDDHTNNIFIGANNHKELGYHNGIFMGTSTNNNPWLAAEMGVVIDGSTDPDEMEANEKAEAVAAEQDADYMKNRLYVKGKPVAMKSRFNQLSGWFEDLQSKYEAWYRSHRDAEVTDIIGTTTPHGFDHSHQFSYPGGGHGLGDVKAGTGITPPKDLPGALEPPPDFPVIEARPDLEGYTDGDDEDELNLGGGP